MYTSKTCTAFKREDAKAEAGKLAAKWFAKSNERPAMSKNIIAAMEWTGPRFVDTTSSK